MIDIIMVGAGGIAKAHARSLLKIAEAKVVGVVDLNREKAEAMANTMGASVYGRLEDCVDFADLVYILTPPSTHPQLMCGMSIESLSHDIDLIRWTAGEIVDVRANIVISNPDLEGFDDNAHVVFTLANGGTAVIHASWSSHLGMNSRGVIGTHGTAVVDGPGLWDSRNFRWKTSDMEHESIEVINDSFANSDSYEMENRYFIDCLVSERQPTITGLDGLAALKVSHAILDSHHKKQVITIK